MSTNEKWTDNPCYYVSVMDGPMFGRILGPFQTESECREWAYRNPEDGGNPEKHNRMKEVAQKCDAKAWFYAYGMVRWANGHENGVINGRVGL